MKRNARNNARNASRNPDPADLSEQPMKYGKSRQGDDRRETSSITFA
jgi:hypothetical protein